MRQWAPLLVGGGFSLVTLFALTPLLLPGSGVGVAAHIVFRGLCHQEVARSFVVDGEQLAVCHRCVGIYAGLALGGFAGLVTAADPRHARWWIAGAVPMAIQVGLAVLWPQPFDLWWLRLATGLVAGFAGGLLVASGLSGAYRRDMVTE